MAILAPLFPLKLLLSTTTSNNSKETICFRNYALFSSKWSYFWYTTNLDYKKQQSSNLRRLSYRSSSHLDDEEGEDETDDCNFREAVELFNNGDYYRCHDFLESLWNKAQEPTRTLLHAILQCAVGFHHLFNQNHKGAMMELGEGVCKLRKMNLERGPLHEFEKDISTVLDFIYHTQLELAACTDEYCLALDQSENSYKLLGGYGAGQRVYDLEIDTDKITYIVFCPERSYDNTGDRPRVKLPILHATEEHLLEIDYI